MSVPLRVHAATHIGLEHHINEDAWSVAPTDEGGLVLLVCDGMGGMGRGDEASALAATTITEVMARGSGMPPERMRQALREADRNVRERLCGGEGEENPGSTAALVYVIDGAAHVAWAGDSRAYLLREDRVLDRTIDHKLVNAMIARGEITPEEAETSDFAHIITRGLGGRPVEAPEVRPEILSLPWKLAHGDVLVLCSDGLCDLVTDDELPGLVGQLPPDRATEALIEVALDRGGHDNITAIVARWEGSTYQEDDVATPVMRPERQVLPDLRTDMPEIELERADGRKVTEEIEQSELQRLLATTPSPAATPAAPRIDPVDAETVPGPQRFATPLSPPRPVGADQVTEPVLPARDTSPPSQRADRAVVGDEERPPPWAGIAMVLALVGGAAVAYLLFA